MGSGASKTVVSSLPTDNPQQEDDTDIDNTDGANDENHNTTSQNSKVSVTQEPESVLKDISNDNIKNDDIHNIKKDKKHTATTPKRIVVAEAGIQKRVSFSNEMQEYVIQEQEGTQELGGDTIVHVPGQTEEPSEAFNQSSETHKPAKSNLKRTKGDNQTLDPTTWSQYEIEALNAHNSIRYIHGVAPLKLNRKLCQMAEKYANQLMQKRDFCHSEVEQRQHKGSPCGENIAAFGVMDCPVDYQGHTAVYQWYEERQYFDYKKPRFIARSSHFCQLVWPDTKEFGQACTMRKDGKWNHYLAVAYYHPMGNNKDNMGAVPPPIINVEFDFSTKENTTTKKIKTS